MPSTIVFHSLSGSKDFKEVLSGKKISSNLFTIFYKNKNNTDQDKEILLSCVAAKKLGNAVKRNRMRRRLKMATRKAIIEIKNNFKKNLNMQFLLNQKSMMRIFKILLMSSRVN